MVNKDNLYTPMTEQEKAEAAAAKAKAAKERVGLISAAQQLLDNPLFKEYKEKFEEYQALLVDSISFIDEPDPGKRLSYYDRIRAELSVFKSLYVPVEHNAKSSLERNPDGIKEVK